MLHLSGLRQTGLTEQPDHYIIEAAIDDYSPKCDCGNPRMVANGRKPVEFVDTPIHDRRVTLRVQRQRYLCRNCGDTDYADIPHVIEAHRITERCFAYITKNGARRTWTMIANATLYVREAGRDREIWSVV